MDILNRIKRLIVRRLYVIKSSSYTGTTIYTKGKITTEQGEETFYLLISSKIGTSRR